MSSQNVYEMKTVQTKVMKDLIDALNVILTDTNIEHSPSGIKIMATDSTHSTFVHLKLDSDRFQYYHCPNKVIKAVSMQNLNQFVKVASNKDTFTMFNNSSDSNRIGFLYENDEKKQKILLKLNTLNLQEDIINIPDIEYDSVLTMNSADFRKHCNDMSSLSDEIEIKNIGQQVIMSCEGDKGSHTVYMGDNEGDIKLSSSSDEIIQGYYNLKLLTLFTKCTNLSNTVKICMKNDFPLMLIYNVGDLGELKLGLTPKIKSNIY